MSKPPKNGANSLTRRDQAGLPQPDRAGLLASAGGARDTHAARENTAAGASSFAVLSHIARSQHNKAHFTQSGDGSEHTQWPITLPYIGGHEEERTYNECFNTSTVAS